VKPLRDQENYSLHAIPVRPTMWDAISKPVETVYAKSLDRVKGKNSVKPQIKPHFAEEFVSPHLDLPTDETRSKRLL
jgi:hypothetical protein